MAQIIRKSSQNQAVKEMMEVHDFTKNEHTHIPQDTQTQIHSSFPSSESQIAFCWGYLKYFNVSWLQSNPLQLLAAILYHPCHKFHCHSGLCFDFYYALIQTQYSGGVQVLHPGLSGAAGTSAPNGSLLFIACAAGVPSSHLPRRAVLLGSSLCCQQLAQQKQRQSMPGDQQEQHSGKLGCKVAITGIKFATGLPLGIETASCFSLRGLCAPNLPTEAKVTLQEVHRWGLGPTGSDSFSSLSVV